MSLSPRVSRAGKWPLFSTGACLLLLCGAALAQGSDPVIAKRGTDQITASQARKLVASTDGELHRKLTTDPAALTEFLRNALLQRAVMAEAVAQKWDQRADVAALAQRAHDQVVAQSFLAAQSQPPAGFPAEAQVQAAYDQNKQRFLKPRTYHLAQVFSPQSGGKTDDARRRLTDLRAQVMHGRLAFDAAGRQDHSVVYADLGWLPENRIVEPVRNAVSGLLENALTDPICLAGGCYVIKLLGTRPAGPATLPEVRDSLVRALRQQQEQASERDYANRLLARQNIQVDEIQVGKLAQP